MIWITVIFDVFPDRKQETYLRLFAGMVLILLVIGPFAGKIDISDQIERISDKINAIDENEEFEKSVMDAEKKMSELEQRVEAYYEYEKELETRLEKREEQVDNTDRIRNYPDDSGTANGE